MAETSAFCQVIENMIYSHAKKVSTGIKTSAVNLSFAGWHCLHQHIIVADWTNAFLLIRLFVFVPVSDT